MLAVKRSAGVAPEVNLRNPLCAVKIACKWGIHPGFKTQGRRHQKSRTGVSVAPQKVRVLQKLKKNVQNNFLLVYLPFFSHMAPFMLFPASKQVSQLDESEQAWQDWWHPTIWKLFILFLAELFVFCFKLNRLSFDSKIVVCFQHSSWTFVSRTVL